MKTLYMRMGAFENFGRGKVRNLEKKHNSNFAFWRNGFDFSSI